MFASSVRTANMTRSMHKRYEAANMEIVPIKTQRDYRRVLKEIEG